MSGERVGPWIRAASYAAPGFILLLVSASPAHANGAMGLALATFDWGPWFAYLAVTVLFEAAVLGRWLQVPFGRAIWTSVFANLLTAVIAAPFTGILSDLFLFAFGSQLNPNPFCETLLLFTIFGVFSAVIEAWPWIYPARRSGQPRSRVLGRSLAAHLIGVPLGMVVLLAPARPYHGLEMQVAAQRDNWLRPQVIVALGSYIEEHHALPPGPTYGDVLEQLRPRLGRFSADPGLWAAAYSPDYHRFDLSEMKRGPMVEWNASAAHIKVRPDEIKRVWLIRSCFDRHDAGVVIILPAWGRESLTRSGDDHELGCGAAPVAKSD